MGHERNQCDNEALFSLIKQPCLCHCLSEGTGTCSLILITEHLLSGTGLLLWVWWLVLDRLAWLLALILDLLALLSTIHHRGDLAALSP